MEPNQSEQLGTMINTQASPQALPDSNVASLVPQSQSTQQQPMNADQAKAIMGNVTYLASFLLPKKKGESKSQEHTQDNSSDVSEKPQNDPGETETPKEDKNESGLETRLTKQIDDLKQQITKNHQRDEITRIEKELQDLLKEDGQEAKS